jgi:phenylacetyl-CoA:acceptor oxidoreductase subunit 2
MTYPAQGYGPYGPDPWHQTSWDARAAGNFIGGGMGGGLVVFAVLSGATGVARIALLLAGLALVGLGLFCVSLELGRPFRAQNVFRNPRTSWMAREAWASALLAPAVLAAAGGVAGVSGLALLLALVFIYCQARLLQAAKGIPAWRAPAVVPLIVATGLVDGGGVFFLAAPWHGTATMTLLVGFGALLLVRLAIWFVYRRRLAGEAAPSAAAALDRAGLVLQLAGTAAPLALIVAAGMIVGDAVLPLVAIAGALAAASGAYVKLVLVTRAGFNQGFVLPHLPVRGARP